MKIFEKFYPDEYTDSTYIVDYKELYDEGYRGIIFDIDNTLVPHGAKADERARNLFKHLKKLGFKVCLLSNNKDKRVRPFNDAVDAIYISNAAKPMVKNYLRAMELMGTKTENTIFIGDQLFTDIYGAKRAGLRTIRVSPIHPKEEIQIVLKRHLERIVIHVHKKEMKNSERKKDKK
ncbi:hypothetical protein SAMN05421730_101645 [Anaerobium acetethylicum]|uniref:YqeG family HAD IIIA-type phosphatase n=1 Tax=Anaerobium acetethylicum TaxID=1619234 RepID=A0A1D3TVC1_9FIRM|nr:YqeG family HAD IIIA-type phosphatase [Anaerobium acetethylicum]SCP98076.1 hypothetical protein SAMN05421730_101645 [Anaerobium acetethylicum]